MNSSKAEQVLELVAKAGILRPRDLTAHGIPREYLRRLLRRGLLVHFGRGLYALPDPELTEHHSLAEACKRVPQGVVCLLSALQFHRMTTQAPFEVWLAIDPKVRRPQPGNLPLRIVRFSGQARSSGVEEYQLEGVTVRVYNPAKTVADCFKYRNKIGLDVALEALRDYWQERRGTMDKLWRYARICRVTNVMRPYLESLGAIRPCRKNCPWLCPGNSQKIQPSRYNGRHFCVRGNWNQKMFPSPG